MANTAIQLKRTSVSGRAANSTTLTRPGELALNMADGILYSTNGTFIFEVGSNTTNSRITGNATIKAIVANSSIGTAGQVLHSNGTGIYWGPDDNSGGTVTSVATGNGMTGGPITTTGTVSILANTGIVANATGTFVNAAYIATISANNSTYLNGKLEAGLNVNSATSSTTATNATQLGGKTEGNLNVNSAIYANQSITNTFTVGTASYFVSNGNFGIANSTPRAKLDVQGDIWTDWTDRFIGTVYQTGTAYKLGMKTVVNTRDLQIYSQGTDGTGVSGITFYTGATPSERMRVSYTGNVGIGNTAPAYKLRVDGDISLSGGIHANSSFSTAKQILTSNGTISYWATPDMSFLPDSALKKSVRAATTADLSAASSTATTLTGSLVALPAQDGITLVVGDRLLVKDQATTSQNGIYDVTNVGSAGVTAWILTRSADADTITEIASAMVAVDSGTVNGGKLFDNDLKTADTLGTTGIVWNQNIDNGGTFVGNIVFGSAAGVYPTSNTVGTGLGSATQRWVINANTLNMSGNLTLSSTSAVSANGTVGTAGQILTSNGTTVYWSTPSTATGTVTSVATGNGMTGGPVTTTGTISILANTGIDANSTGAFVNATYIGTLSANNTTYVNGKTEGNLNVNNATTAYSKTEGALNVNSATTATNSTQLGGKTEGNLNVNNATTAYGKTEGALNVNSATTATTATNSTQLGGKTEGNLNVNNATQLATTRTINGVNFNGTANILIPSLYDSNYRRITNPGGAEYVTSTATVTGAIQVTLPVGATDTMIRMTIKVYEYATNESFEIHCGGYAYNVGPTWANNPFAYIVGNPSIDRRFTVRFGYTAAGKMCVYVGELNSTWSYPQVYVTDVQLGYNGMAATYTTGWAISFQASAFENVAATITNPQIGYATSTNTGNAVVLRDGSGNFTAGIITANLTGTATSSTQLNGKTEGNLNVNSATTATTATNSTQLGGVAAASYQLNSTLSANVATMTSNNSTFAYGKTEGNLNVNSATTATTATNATQLGGVAAANYVQNTDTRTLSGNLTFSGANVNITGNLRFTGGLIANSSLGTAGQILYTTGTTVYWANSASGGSGGGYYKGGSATIGSLGSQGQNLFRVNANTLNYNTTIAAGENAQATGPITVAGGVTLTIDTGGRVAIV